MSAHCTPHLERLGITIPAYRLDLCEACFRGLPLSTEKPKPKPGRPTCSDCGRPISYDNISGRCRYCLYTQPWLNKQARRERIPKSDISLAVQELRDGAQVATIQLNGRHQYRVGKAAHQYAYRHGFRISCRRVGEAMEVQRREHKA